MASQSYAMGTLFSSLAYAHRPLSQRGACLASERACAHVLPFWTSTGLIDQLVANTGCRAGSGGGTSAFEIAITSRSPTVGPRIIVLCVVFHAPNITFPQSNVMGRGPSRAPKHFCRELPGVGGGRVFRMLLRLGRRASFVVGLALVELSASTNHTSALPKVLGPIPPGPASKARHKPIRPPNLNAIRGSKLGIPKDAMDKVRNA